MFILIEDVPTQISSIYQSLFVVFGALITYRIFIKKDTSLESIVKHALVAYGCEKRDELQGKAKIDEEKPFTDERLAKKLVEHYLESFYRDIP